MYICKCTSVWSFSWGLGEDGWVQSCRMTDSLSYRFPSTYCFCFYSLSPCHPLQLLCSPLSIYIQLSLPYFSLFCCPSTLKTTSVLLQSPHHILLLIFLSVHLLTLCLSLCPHNISTKPPVFLPVFFALLCMVDHSSVWHR